MDSCRPPGETCRLRPKEARPRLPEESVGGASLVGPRPKEARRRLVGAVGLGRGLGWGLGLGLGLGLGEGEGEG